MVALCWFAVLFFVRVCGVDFGVLDLLVFCVVSVVAAVFSCVAVLFFHCFDACVCVCACFVSFV